jgi:hypothetical protein
MMKIRRLELKTLVEEVINEKDVQIYGNKKDSFTNLAGREKRVGRRGVGFDKDTAGTKKWMKMADKYYKNIQSNIKRFPHSAHAYSLAKALKAIDVETSKDL